MPLETALKGQRELWAYFSFILFSCFSARAGDAVRNSLQRTARTMGLFFLPHTHGTRIYTFIYIYTCIHIFTYT
jgi:hypothetical protein